jgi:signal transduction histidine kinase
LGTTTLERVAATAAPLHADDAERLVAAVCELSHLRDLDGVMQVVRRTARELSGADGVTFVLREGNLVHYAEENAIGPLWKGRRFPAQACISGWAMIHRQTVVIEDIDVDDRIPHDAYAPTFVKSLAMIPIRRDDPIGAIGAYWARRHRASPREIRLLEALAGSTAVALANAELLRQLRDAVRTRDEFICVASHELKTPLTPLQLQLETLDRGLERGQPVADTRRVVERLHRQVRRVARLVHNLLDVTAASNGTVQLDREELDLAALVQDVTATFEAELARAGQRLTVLAEAPVKGRWDRRRIEQVVANLLSNAMRFGDGKPVEVAVEVAGEAGDRARITVRDQGRGISADDQRRLFERFARLGPAPDPRGGFGIGLWLARRIVEAHGGTIHLMSGAGAGSTFAVSLPR